MAISLKQEILHIHNAILKEAQEFEEAARELNREDDTQITGLLGRFKFYRSVLHEHEHGEEEFFFPFLEEKFRYVAATYVFDHNEHSGLYDEIEELLTGLRQAQGNSERAELAQRLNRQAIALNVKMDSHIYKENELLVPAFEEHFTLEEQGKVMDQAMKTIMSIAPELMMQIFPWEFRAQTVDDREGMLRSWSEMMPPDQ